MSNNQHRATYRFALYGRSGSGKTCMLAALAMNRLPNVSGFTCDRLPVPLPRPIGEPNSWDPKDRAATLHNSADWLDTAIERISEGDVPAPNPPLDSVMRFHFDFTSPDHRTYRIELVDYSGELVDTGDLANPESLSARLKEHLLEMDGLLVLAEAPRNEQHAQPLGEELHRLSQAFASLRGDKQQHEALNAPVVMLVNKWDRQSTIEFDNPTGEEEKLAEFLRDGSAPTHLRLADAISNGVCRGNFRSFPVSAFGESEDASTDDREIERPKTTTPLQSFGLEDGFIWLARRRDALDLADFENTAESRSTWRMHMPLFPDRTVRHGKSLGRRFPKESDEFTRVQSGLSTARKIWWGRQVLTLLIMLGLSLSVESGIDHLNYVTGTLAAGNPKSSDGRIDRYEAWLEQYCSSPQYRHAIYNLVKLPRSQAREELDKLRETRVTRDWRHVEAKEDIFEKSTAADKHLERFPNSPYRGQAREIQDAAVAITENRENDSWFSKLQSDAQDLESQIDVAHLNELLVSVDAIPFPSRESNEEFEARQALRGKIAEQLNSIASRIEWDEFVGDYNLLMREKQFLTAGNLLSQRMNRESAANQVLSDEMQQLVVQYRQDAPRGLKTQLRELVRDYRWQEAYTRLDQQEREVQQWPKDLQWSDHRTQAVAERQHLEAAHDKHLYQQFARKRTTSAARVYQETAPIKSMIKEVMQYSEWLDLQDNVLELSLVLERIEWGKSAQDANDNRIVVKVNEKKIAEKTSVISKANSNTGELAKHTLNKKLDEFVTLAVTVIEEDSWISFTGGDDDHGSGTASVRIRELLSGYTLPLTAPDYRHQAIFRAHGLTAEPTLPRWRSK